MTGLPNYHAARWDEPLVLEMGRPGRRGLLVGEAEPALAAAVGAGADLVPEAVRRARPPALPELSEFEVQRHYLHLAQMTLGMMGVNLFGTCTMKYNPRLNEHWRRGRGSPSCIPGRTTSTLQGVLEIVHGLRPHAARAVRHGALRVPARRRRGRRVHACVRHARVARRARRARARATR